MAASRQQKKPSRNEDARGARRTSDAPLDTSGLPTRGYGGATNVERLGLDNELRLGAVPKQECASVLGGM